MIQVVIQMTTTQLNSLSISIIHRGTSSSRKTVEFELDESKAGQRQLIS
jgi:hypothetical protein